MIDYRHPSHKLLSSIDIHELLPQQEPFVFVDELDHYDETTTVTALNVKGAHLLVEQGHLTTAGLIENIAQTCSARIGYVNKYILHRAVAPGVLAEVKNMKIVSQPKVRQMVTTRVDITAEVFGMMLAHATVSCEGEVIAETDIKLSLKD